METPRKFDYPALPAGVMRDFLQLRQKALTVVDFKDDFFGEEISDPERLCRNPAVSIHTITYNHAKFVGKCLDSLLAQKTSFPFEIIIGEDCSTDDTRKIILEYQRKYPETIRVIVSDRNVGCRRNRVRCDVRTRGEFVAYCEGDDFWTDPEKLQRQYDVMSADESIGLCFSNGDTVTEAGAKVRPFHLARVKPGLSDVNEMYGLLQERAVNFPTASAMIRNLSKRWDAESLFQHFLYSLSMGDTPTWFLVSANCRTYYFPENMIARHCHATSLSQTWNASVAMMDNFLLLGYFSKFGGETDDAKIGNALFTKYIRAKVSQKQFGEAWRALTICRKSRRLFGLFRYMLAKAPGVITGKGRRKI